MTGQEFPGEPVAMAVKKNIPLVTHLPHVKKVIDEAPPEYIIMIVVAFLQVFAMTISLVHILNKHRAFNRIKPGMVGPTMALLSFYWFIATFNVLGLFVLRANLLCQAIASCYDALIGYLFAVLLIAYSNGKLSYLSVLRWRDVMAPHYTCSSACCCNTVTRAQATRAVTLIVQMMVVFCATYLAELICQNENLYLYPAPLYKSHITMGLKCAQVISLLGALYGFVGLCRAASIVQPRASPFIKLIMYKCIYILSAIQGNVLLYLAFNKILPAVSDIEPITRAVVWSNFATVTECTFAYFIAVRVYKIDDYTLTQPFKSDGTKTRARVQKEAEFYRTTFEAPVDNVSSRRSTLEVDLRRAHSSADDVSLSTPEVGLDNYNLLDLKLLGLNVKLSDEVEERLSLSSLRRGSLSKDNVHRDSFQGDSPLAVALRKDSIKGHSIKSKFDLSSEDDSPKNYLGKLKKGSRASRSADTMRTDDDALNLNSSKTAKFLRSDKAETTSYSKLSEEDSSQIEPKVRIVGGKVNISLSSKDIAKLCKSSADDSDHDSISMSLNLNKLPDEAATNEERTQNKSVKKLEKNRVTFEETGNSLHHSETNCSRHKDGRDKSRHSMQFLRSLNNSSDDEDTESERSSVRTIDPSQYVSKISLV